MLREKFKEISDLIDKKLRNWTIMVVIVANLILATWFITNNVNANLTANLLESQKKVEVSQYIVIEGKKYKIILEKVD